MGEEVIGVIFWPRQLKAYIPPLLAPVPQRSWGQGPGAGAVATRGRGPSFQPCIASPAARESLWNASRAAAGWPSDCCVCGLGK